MEVVEVWDRGKGAGGVGSGVSESDDGQAMGRGERGEEEEEEEESLFRADAVNREEKETRLFHGMRMAPGTCRIGHRHRV